MEINCTNENGKLIIALEGRLDTVTSQDLMNKVPLENRKGLDIVFDFTNLQYISSAGLRVLITFKKDADATGNSLLIKNPNEVIKEIFKVTGFDKILKVE